MTNLVLMSANTDNPKAYDHFRKTLFTKYYFKENIFKDPSEKLKLLSIFPDGRAFMWGNLPAKKREWEKFVIGDRVLISQDGFYILMGTIVYKIHDENLANSIWGVNENGKTWEYIFFLDNFQEINIHAKEINERMEHYPGLGIGVYEEKVWRSKLGSDFGIALEELQEETNLKEELEAEKTVEKQGKSKDELKREAENYVSKIVGYEKKLKERKERRDDELQKARIKKLEDNSCQIDGECIEYEKDGKIKRYVEAAHITPKIKGGDESIRNIIILCPNCHKKLDLGIIKIDFSKKMAIINGREHQIHHDFHLFL